MSSTHITSDNEIVLDKLYKQPCDDTPSWVKGEYKYVEKFKGPYEQLLKLPFTNFYPGNLRSAAIANLDIVDGGFSVPSTPNGKVWLITEAKVEEIVAGEHAILTVTSTARPIFEASGEGAGFANDPDRETWQLKWQSYTVPPMGFILGKTRSEVEVSADDDSDYWQDLSGYADAGILNKYFAQPANNDAGDYQYRDGASLYWLNHVEGLVAEKIKKNEVALYHYPVVIHTTVKYSALSSTAVYPDEVAENIDTVVELPSDCKIKFDDDDEWTWIKIDDSLQCEGETRVQRRRWTRTESFMGVKLADVNFYGSEPYSPNDPENTRWPIGGI